MCFWQHDCSCLDALEPSPDLLSDLLLGSTFIIDTLLGSFLRADIIDKLLPMAGLDGCFFAARFVSALDSLFDVARGEYYADLL